jgi:choline dehydrogenase-like flavoprotein
MTYALDDNTRAMIRFGLERAREAFREAGAREVLTQDLLVQAGFHLLGTARMGRDPAASVVDEWQRAHDCPNLVIADGSVFVTAAAVNPTPTLQALALRAADALIRDRRRVRTAA